MCGRLTCTHCRTHLMMTEPVGAALHSHEVLIRAAGLIGAVLCAAEVVQAPQRGRHGVVFLDVVLGAVPVCRADGVTRSTICFADPGSRVCSRLATCVAVASVRPGSPHSQRRCTTLPSGRPSEVPRSPVWMRPPADAPAWAPGRRDAAAGSEGPRRACDPPGFGFCASSAEAACLTVCAAAPSSCQHSAHVTGRAPCVNACSPIAWATERCAAAIVPMRSRMCRWTMTAVTP